MHAACRERELLVSQLVSITDEIIALEVNPSRQSPHQLQEVHEQRQKLLEELGEHVASHGCGIHHAAA